MPSNDQGIHLDRSEVDHRDEFGVERGRRWCCFIFEVFISGFLEGRSLLQVGVLMKSTRIRMGFLDQADSFHVLGPLSGSEH